MNLKEWAGLIGSIGGGGWWVWSKIIKPRLVEEKRNKEEFRKKQKEFQEKVLYELTYAGNGSIKNAIRRIDRNVNRLTERQKIAMNMQNIAFWISDEKGMCIYASPELCKVMGRSESEIIGDNWSSWLIHEDKERVFEEWMFAVEHKTVFDSVHSYERSDGSTVKVWGLSLPEIVDGEQTGRLGKLEILN